MELLGLIKADALPYLCSLELGLLATTEGAKGSASHSAGMRAGAEAGAWAVATEGKVSNSGKHRSRNREALVLVQVYPCVTLENPVASPHLNVLMLQMRKMDFRAPSSFSIL